MDFAFDTRTKKLRAELSELEPSYPALERHVDDLMPGLLRIHAVGPLPPRRS